MIDSGDDSSLTLPSLPVTQSPASSIIGQILIEAGALNSEEVSEVIKCQAMKGLRFGEAAVQLGLIKDADVRFALARQYDYSYVNTDEPCAIDPAVFAAYQPFDRRAERLRTLRSQLSTRWFVEQRRALAVISPNHAENGSTLAANLAVSFAQLGDRTLLIDANMRSPRQHTLFGVPDFKGLSNLLAGRSSFRDALVYVKPIRGLYLLPAGVRVPNAQELLAGSAFASLLALAPSKFKVVIIDTPPALDSSDAQIVAARAGACLIVARRHHTKVRNLRRVAASLNLSGTEILGVSISD